MPAGWRPTRIERHIESFATSAETVQVATDAGVGYLKAMGNKNGPHILACEWVGTQLADWLGLATFDYALIRLVKVPEIPLASGRFAEPGPAFIARAEEGTPWGGSAKELRKIENVEDISRLVVFDTWTRNVDRFPPTGESWKPNRDNVFLSAEGARKGRFRLRAMDQTQCFTRTNELSRQVGRIEAIRDTRVYGDFPEFAAYLDEQVVYASCKRLKRLGRSKVEQVVDSIPPEWEVERRVRESLSRLVLDRARFVADHILGWLWPQKRFDFFYEKDGES